MFLNLFLAKKKNVRACFIRIIQGLAAQHSPIIVTTLHAALFICIKLLQMKTQHSHFFFFFSFEANFLKVHFLWKGTNGCKFMLCLFYLIWTSQIH